MQTEDVRKIVESSDSPRAVIGSGKFSAKKKGESLVKKQYQISKRRAAEKFQAWAMNNTVPIQLTFPTAGIAELAQQSLGDLLRGGQGVHRNGYGSGGA